MSDARAAHDASNRRKTLGCSKETQAGCTLCAGIFSTAWVSAVAVRTAAALAAEVESDGFLTPVVRLALTGCIGGSSSAYAACIVKCVG